VPAPPASVVVPTRGRPGYLDIALGSIAPQAAAAGAEVIVVDDGPDEATRALAGRHGVAYVPHDHPRGLNAARNTGIGAAAADLLVFVDDDVAACPGWLEALIAAADALPVGVGVFTGPIRAELEGGLRMCGREGPPITFQDFGPEDCDAPHAWGANLSIRRAALARIGAFDEARLLAGDEEEWLERWRGTGGRIRYVAAAAVLHRRAAADARLGALCRAERARGRASRRWDVDRGRARPLRAELRVLAGCLVHTVRYRCANGLCMAAHALGRAEEAIRPVPPPAVRGINDFLSGRSGALGGWRRSGLRLADLALDAEATLTGRRRRLNQAARGEPPTRRVLVLGVVRPQYPNLMAAAQAELGRSRHEVEIALAQAGDRGKWENVNALLSEHGIDGRDWVFIIDDDVALPPGFLDRFLCVAERGDLRIAQPAHRRRSQAAWPVTRRRPGADGRETSFVETGPVTAFRLDALASLLPFPPLRAGWGLDTHWSAIARERGWPIGIIDATPIAHTLRPVAGMYSRREAVEEAREFLVGRPYIRRDEARTLRPL
jgi:GT2 family glycosyltransferase